VRAFATARDYEFTTAAAFVRDAGERLRWIAATKPDLAQWRDHFREHVASRTSFVDYLKEDFHPADVLFVVLGIASAFGLVSKATMQKRVAARQALREQAAAAAPAADVPPPT
jgi:hypothetical protein